MAHSNKVGEIPGGGTVFLSLSQNETISPATEINSPAKKKKQDWTLEQKLAIIDEAKSDKGTGRKYGVSRYTIHNWRKTEEKIRAEVDGLAHSNKVGAISGGETVLFSHSQNETTTPATKIDSPAKKKKPNWTLEQKLAIIEEAKSSTNRRTAKRHEISQSLI